MLMALISGALVMAADVLVLALLFRLLWQRQRVVAKLKLVLLLLLNKLLLLGGGTYLALVVWRQEIGSYVLGALLMLVLMLLLAIVLDKRLYSRHVLR